MSIEESSAAGAKRRAEKSNPEEDGPAATNSPAEETLATADGCAAGAHAESEQTVAADLSPEDLREKLAEAMAQAKANWDNALRAQAELENLRKRSQRDIENAHKFGIERFLQELLPVRDSMELGFFAASEDGVDLASVREGVELTLKMLAGAMEKFGIEDVNPIDAPFDPEFHQAMSTQEVEGVEPGTVTMVMQKGYLLNGRLVRPALVMVAK